MEIDDELENKMEEEQEAEKQRVKERNVLIFRAIGFFITLLTPAVYIFFAFDCYKFTDNKMSVSGWGILGTLLLVAGLWVFFKYVLFGGTYRYRKQITKTIVQIALPLLALTLIIASTRNFYGDLLTVSIVCLISWSIAGIVNPFPELAYKQSGGATDDYLDYLFGKNKNKKK